jgi:hypothetical protein
MKRPFVTPLAILTILVAPAEELSAQEWTDEQIIASAPLAAPPDMRDGAEIRGWTEDGHLRVVKEGSNGVICLGDEPGDDRFQVVCYHRALEPFLERGRQLRREGWQGMEYQEKRWSEVESGLLEMPRMPAILFNMGGALTDYDAETNELSNAGRLQTVYMPYATPELTGLPTQAPPGQPWLMWPGRPSAHIMIVLPPSGGE